MSSENSGLKRSWKEGLLKVWIICLFFSLALLFTSAYGLNKSFREDEVILKGRLSKATVTGISTILPSGLSLVYEYIDDTGNIQTDILYQDYSYDEAMALIGTELDIYIYGEMSKPAGSKTNYIYYMIFLIISVIASCFFLIMSWKNYKLWRN